MANNKTTKSSATKKRNIAKQKRKGGFKKGAYKCSKCDRKFSMPAHLTRHMNAIHGTGKKKKVAGKKVTRGRKARQPGRLTGVGARLGLRNMTIEQLSEVIVAARQVANEKIAELQEKFG